MRTTKENYRKFQEYAKEWQQKLGLTNWGLFFAHKPINHSYGECSWSMSDQLATVTLATTWDKYRPLNDIELNKVALHEMLHLLLAIYCSQAEARYTTQDAIDIAEHSIIRQLENVLL